MKADTATDLVVTRTDTTAIPFIMSTERIAGFEDLVGCWDEEKHRARSPTAAMHISSRARATNRSALPSCATGLAGTRDAGQAHCGLQSRPRIWPHAATPVVDLVFRETDVWRLWLGVFPENVRAQKSYAAVASSRKAWRAQCLLRGVHPTSS